MIEQFKNIQYNVKLTYIFTVIAWSARTILFQQILSGYIFILTNNSNKYVGLVKGLVGVTQLLFSFPAGYAADHYRRDVVLKIASFIGFIVASLTFCGFFFNSILMCMLAYGGWGIYNAVQTPALEAIFADSVPQGQRTKPYTNKYVLQQLAQTLGPLISIVLFLIYGNSWSLPELKMVLYFGIFLALVSLVFLVFFNDDYALENVVEKQQNQQKKLVDSTEQGYNSLQKHQEESSTSTSLRNADSQHELVKYEANEYQKLRDSFSETTPTEAEIIPLEQQSSTTNHLVPYLIFTSDFIMMIGAGMTINFFSTFFLDEYNLSPISINILFLFQPIIVVIFSIAARKLSITFKRIIVIIVSRFISVLCLIVMSYAESLKTQIILFLLRAGFMRCTQALRRSLLMDHVPKDKRARWNSLEGLTMFSWAGSAVLGGYIIDSFDYRFCFRVTSAIYCVGLVLELLLIPMTDLHLSITGFF